LELSCKTVGKINVSETIYDSQASERLGNLPGAQVHGNFIGTRKIQAKKKNISIFQ
jgi:hypothetical protein